MLVESGTKPSAPDVSTGPFSVVVPLPQLSVGTNKLPATMEASLVQLALAVQMAANTFVATPPPLFLTGETVGVVVASVQVPFASDLHPMRTSPTLEATLAVPH